MFLAGYGWGSFQSRREIAGNERMQAPARRLARTIIVLGKEDGTKFALQALCAIKNACIASLGDCHRLQLWWSTLVSLRWSFWALVETSRSGGIEDNPFNGFEWIKSSLSPKISSLELWMFKELVDRLWNLFLLPKTKHMDPINYQKADSLASIWINALTVVVNEISDPGRPNAASRTLLSVLKQQVLLAIANRMDMTLLHQLIDSNNPLFKPLTSSQGLEMKIFVQKIARWMQDMGVSSHCFNHEDHDSTRRDAGDFLPRITSAANIMVTPKSSLLDSDVRNAVAPNLSISSICDILMSYQTAEADECSTGTIFIYVECLPA